MIEFVVGSAAYIGNSQKLSTERTTILHGMGGNNVITAVIILYTGLNCTSTCLNGRASASVVH